MDVLHEMSFNQIRYNSNWFSLYDSSKSDLMTPMSLSLWLQRI